MEALRGIDSVTDLLRSQITEDSVEEAVSESGIFDFNRPECSSPANKRISIHRFHSIRNQSQEVLGSLVNLR